MLSTYFLVHLLIAVIAALFIVLATLLVIDKLPTPLPDEFTKQLIGDSTIDHLEKTKMAHVVPNSRWFDHTFNRARRKR